jgi:hypothetical protein
MLAADPAGLFGGLALSLTEDRGAKGWRWRVDDPFDGTVELFLQPVGDGCTVHAFLRARQRAEGHLLDRVMAVVRQSLWRAKDLIEAERGAGESATDDPLARGGQGTTRTGRFDNRG